MLHDFAMWRGDRAFLETMMPGMRQTIERFIVSVDDEGMLDLPPGWNFIDWVPQWKQRGAPWDASGRSSINQWQMIMTLGQVAELSGYMGDEDLARRVLPLRDRMV